MRKLFALAILLLTFSMAGCESCALFHGEKARPYPVCAPACEPSCVPTCTPGCAPMAAPTTGCASSAPTVGTVSTSASPIGVAEPVPGSST